MPPTSSPDLLLLDLPAVFQPLATPRPDESDDQFADRIDTELMTRFRDGGRREDFDALYEHAQGRVLIWLRWLLREQRARFDPVDLLQDTFVNVFRYSSSFRTDHSASFRVWVRTIASNVLRRARTNAPRRWVGGEDEIAPEVPDTSFGPHLCVVHVEDIAQLRGAWLIFLQHYARAFAALSPRDRTALDMVEIQGLSYAETGRLLGVGPSNMKMIMLRARRRLQLHMRVAMQSSTDSAATEHVSPRMRRSA